MQIGGSWHHMLRGTLSQDGLVTLIQPIKEPCGSTTCKAVPR